MRTAASLLAVAVGLGALAACGSSAAPPGASTAPASATVDPSAAAAAPQTPAPEPTDGDVALTTTDGITLAATYLPGPAGSNHAVVFLHQLSSTRAEWQPFVDALRDKVHVLALDMRGHGASIRGTGGVVDWQTFQTADWEAVTNDLAAAAQFLSAKGVALGGTVFVGSSIGSTAVLRFAGDHPDVGGIVLFSPGLKYRGVETVPAAQKYGRPKLVIYSSDAEDAARVLEATWKRATNLAQPQPVTMHQVEGKAHGVKMLADDPQLVEVVVAFVEKTLGP